MVSAFLRLYFLLVLTIVAAGYGLDQLWRVYSNEVENKPDELLTLANIHLQSIPEAQWHQRVQELNQQLAVQFKLMPRSAFAASDELQQRLQSGQSVALESESQATLWIQRIPNSSWLLTETSRVPSVRANLELFLLMLFYALVALVVLLWVWPLNQSLRRLEKAAQAFGMGDWSAKATVKKGSPVEPLARAFNQMAQRISELIRSNKELRDAVSHELRTPLARTKFALAMASEADAPAALQNHLASIGQDVAEMDALINGLLGYASFERSETRLTLQRGDFSALIEEKIEQTQQSLPRPIRIEFVGQQKSSVAICDFYLMERVLQNLLQNALRFAHQRIDVSFSVVSDQYRLTVDDDGPGVPMAERTRIFDAFVRLEHEQHAGAGFGLGLAIVRRIVEWHKGEILVDDSPLGGARFVVQWPLQTAEAALHERESGGTS